MKNKVFNLFLFAYFVLQGCLSLAIPHYYCTPSDERHYHLLKNLIGSIHHVDFEKLKEIAVFDLGLTPKQRAELNTMAKVAVYDVEMVHPDLLTYFVTSPQGRRVRGCFAWKPVIIKQALEKFPYVLYVDAGTTILKPLDDLFNYIQENGYFLMSCTKNERCNLVNRITGNVSNAIFPTLSSEQRKFLLNEDTYMIDAGMQGLSRTMMDSYVLPVYELAKNIDLFKDDGTAKFGYGEGRHDQTLFTIFAHTLKLKIVDEGFFDLDLFGNVINAHIFWNRSGLNEKTIIYRSRHDISFEGGKTNYIKYKKKWSILIPTLEERKKVFQELYTKLTKQIKDNNLENLVEVVVSSDNRTKSIGKKRNELLEQSTGEYICFVDDDDDIHEHYIEMIYNALLTNPDCVNLIGVKTTNGKQPRTFIHSIKYTSWFEKDSIYYRPPNHLNPIRRDIAIKFKFPEKNHGEDADWSMQIARSGLLKKEASISNPYYFYRFLTTKNQKNNTSKGV